MFASREEINLSRCGSGRLHWFPIDRNKVNTTALDIQGWTTVLAIFAARIGLAVTCFL
jgi:hypothetical protein